MATKSKKNTTVSLLNLIGLPFYKILIFILHLAGILVKVGHITTKLKIPQIKPTKIKKFKIPNLISRTNTFRLGTLIILSTLTHFSIFHDLPNPGDLTTHPPKLTTQILDRNGQLLFKIYKQENRTLISLDTLPNHVKNAFLAAEDKNFYSHNGFSLASIFRAFSKNVYNFFTVCRLSITNCYLEGGSTVTQQLVKNTLLTPQRSLTRKIKELV